MGKIIRRIVYTMRVKNIKGTSDRTPPPPYQNLSWKDFYAVKRGREYIFCACKDCMNLVEVGAHVIKADVGTDDKWYIVPLCKTCNNRTDIFEVDSDDLVSIY